MSSLLSVLNVARDGLLAQTAGVNVTGQNIANVNTPGYARRTVNLETVATSGAFGSVRASLGRVVDRFAAARATTESGKQSAAQARSFALATAESILAPSGGATIADRTSAFFSSMTALAQSPSDAAARAGALDAAGQLAQSISGAAAQLDGQRSDLLGQAQGVAGEINQRLTSIAKLNTQIASAQAGGEVPADLTDQRDALVREVGQRVDVQAIPQANGSVTLLSSGAALVDGAHASAIEVAPGSGGALTITVRAPGGGATDVTTAVTSGTLGGIREARDTDLAKVSAQLDHYAYDLTTNVNALHTTGYGLDGQTGRPLFTQAASAAGAARAMSVSQAVAGNPSAIAATTSAGSLPGGNDLAISLAQLAAQPQGSAGSPAQAFASVAGLLGTAKQSADDEVTLRGSTVAQADALRDSASGVSIDEEMVNLTRYQRAFQASQKVLETVDSLLDGLLRSL
jgi:flagellar hook-associated protein 1 FlgK